MISSKEQQVTVTAVSDWANSKVRGFFYPALDGRPGEPEALEIKLQ